MLAVLIPLLTAAWSASPDALARIARSDASLVARGEAITALAGLRSSRASEALQGIYTDEGVDPLVRTWAAAARIQQARSLQEVVSLAPLLATFPALSRPMQLQIAQLPAEEVPIIEAAALMSTPLLQEPVGAVLLSQPTPALVAAMLTAPDDGVRRTLAGLLATKSGGDVQAAVVDALAYRAQDGVPWEGGALFIPSLPWQPAEAQQLIGALIAWHLHCDRLGLPEQQRQLDSNLRSIQLLRAAGISRASETTTAGWLRVWGQAMGAGAVRLMLAEQDALGQYSSVFIGLPEPR